MEQARRWKTFAFGLAVVVAASGCASISGALVVIPTHDGQGGYVLPKITFTQNEDSFWVVTNLRAGTSAATIRIIFSEADVFDRTQLDASGYLTCEQDKYTTKRDALSAGAVSPPVPPSGAATPGLDCSSSDPATVVKLRVNHARGDPNEKSNSLFVPGVCVAKLKLRPQGLSATETKLVKFGVCWEDKPVADPVIIIRGGD